MIKLYNLHSNQITAFMISLIIFLIAAKFGWEKLHYGFNFFDEGYHMTESWRLTAGDELFQDKIRGALDLSPIINSIFFRINPDITLLNFRQIQFILTICALILFSVALYKADKIYWFQPLIFSLFAYTGANTTGIPNLSKNTYPHLFIIFHLTFFLLGLREKSVIIKRTMLTISGFFLWLISFNLLTMSIILFAPLIPFYLFRKWKTDFLSFDFRDLCFLYAPILLCWTIFIAIFSKDYLNKIIPCIQLNMQWGNHYSIKSLLYRFINWETAKYIAIDSVFIIVFLNLLRYRKVFFLTCGFILSFLMYYVIDTSFWGLVQNPMPFYSRPIWFACLLVSMYLLFIFYVIWKIWTRRLNEGEVISLILLTPCAILSISNSVLTVNGLIAVLWASVPVIGAINILLLSNRNVKKQPYLIQLLILIIFFAPFYYSTAWSSWHYPYADVSPEYANETIEHGFGRGIKTNIIYKSLYNWISANAEKYTSKDDFIISYTCSPMVYMIAKRRPALDNSWNDYHDAPPNYKKMAVASMTNEGRIPKMAFVFEQYPILIQSENETFGMSPRQFHFPSYDPILQYIVQNMYFLGQFQLRNDFTIRCFVRR